MIQKINLPQIIKSNKDQITKNFINEKAAIGHINETKGMEFKGFNVEFYPEDVEKMKLMNQAEENAFKLRLKFNKRYIIPDYNKVN